MVGAEKARRELKNGVCGYSRLNAGKKKINICSRCMDILQM